MTPPLLVGSEEILELLLHLAAQREAVVGGGAVGHHQVLSSPGHQLGVLGVGVGEEPGVVLDQADPGLQEDDQPGVVVLLCGLNADVDLPQYAGLAGTQVVSLLWVQLLPSSSRWKSETGNITKSFYLLSLPVISPTYPAKRCPCDRSDDKHSAEGQSSPLQWSHSS